MLASSCPSQVVSAGVTILTPSSLKLKLMVLETIAYHQLVFFQIAITRQTVVTNRYVLQVPRSLAPPRNESLLIYSHGLLLHHFLQLNPLIAQVNRQPFAAGITQLHTQRETQYSEAKWEKEAKEKSTI